MWESLKKFIHSNHDRIVVVEDNEPRYVIMPIAEYTALIERGRQADSTPSINSPQSNSGQAPQADSTEALQKVNNALQEAHESESLISPPIVPQKEPEDRRRSGISIEDLPI
ncbi:MAG: hypothetical protein HYV65_03605 [Candidatus Spechtbacteria bacterium]|nr:hypothetical protein [Candidatus Spechtbacteria bacterium]